VPKTIASRKTKEFLAKLKENKFWDRFLFELVKNCRRRRAEKALEELRKIEFDSSYGEIRLKLRLLPSQCSFFRSETKKRFSKLEEYGSFVNGAEVLSCRMYSWG
jgi:hypothetical protein